MAKPPSSLVRWACVNSSRKTSSIIPTDSVQVVHLRHTLSWTSCVLPITARKGSVKGSTPKEQNRAWHRWTTWTESVGIIDDIFLDGFTQAQRTRLLGGYTMAVRNGRYSVSVYQTLVEGTVRNSVSYVAQTFRDNDR